MRALDLEVLLRIQELSGETARTMFFTEEHLAVRLSSFHGIELEEWPAQIAATALHLVEHQANQAMELALGSAPDPLPLDKIKSIVVGNALRVDWATVLEPTEHLYIMGNPPFIGISLRSAAQVDDLQAVWGPSYHGSLDYVTGWYIKAMQLLDSAGYGGKFAFVSTNSITQGEAVSSMFRPIFNGGWRIGFAHRTFSWTSEAPGAAAVHCAILGFDKTPKQQSVLYDYADLKGEPARIAVRQGITAYLTDGVNVLVDPATRPLAPDLPEVRYGNKPTDGGNLIVEPEAHAVFAADPIASKYLRPFLGARELIHGEERWCLWLPNLDPSDLSRSQLLKSRVEGVRLMRSESKASSTRDAAATPHLFRQIAPVTTAYICIPRHVSETRKFFPVKLVAPDVIASDANFIADDPDGLVFAVISSSAFITWQKAVGGRIKSDLRFNKLQTWNTFPMPKLSPDQRAAIIAGGRAVLDARALRPERSLADHYNPLAMSPELLRAHRELDAAVDKTLGLRGVATEVDRLRALFASYAKLTTVDELAMPKKRSRKARAVSAVS